MILVFCCRSTASVRTANAAGTDQRPGQAPFAPGAGAPTGSGQVLVFCCRSTAPGANREPKRAPISAPGRPHSHPGRVLLRVRGRFWFFSVGAPPPVRTAHEAGTDWRLGQAPFAPGAGAPT